MLGQLTGSLCDALTGRADGQATLEALERANLFLVPLDEEHTWFRYQHLFGDFLRQRLKRQGGDLAGLHRRAAAWYAGSDLPQRVLPKMLERMEKTAPAGADLKSWKY